MGYLIDTGVIPADHCVWKRAPDRSWGSAITSTRHSLEPIAVDGFPGWVAGARVSGAEIG